MPFTRFSGKWNVRIVCLLADGPRRFGELRRTLPGITQQMLTTQLRELEQKDLYCVTPLLKFRRASNTN